MITFLKLVAAFIVAIIVLVIAVLIFIRWKFRSFLKNMMDAAASASGTVPPYRITLQPKDDDDDDEDWMHESEVEQLSHEFAEAGFTVIGDYDVEGLPLQVRAFQHQEYQAYGVIYDHAVVGTWSDVVRRYADDTSWTVSSTKQHGMDAAPWHTAWYLSGEPVATLLKKLLETSPGSGYQKAGADHFVDRFETAYKREMDWRIERGGATEQEIRRIAEMNNKECSEEEVQQIQHLWKSAIGDFLSERALNSWRKVSGIPSREYNRIVEQLIVVHDRLTADQIFDLAYDPDFDDEEEDEDSRRNMVKESCSAESPTVAFKRILEHQKSESNWKQLGEVQKPLKAEIWEHQEEEDEDDNGRQNEDDDF